MSPSGTEDLIVKSSNNHDPAHKADSVPKTMLLFAALTVILIMSNLLVPKTFCSAGFGKLVWTHDSQTTAPPVHKLFSTWPFAT